MIKKAHVIALYLPQYHPTANNNKWWGKGFTEWTNVGKARPLFLGHYQPKVPADLGYYDLRMPEIREEQVSLAKKAGIEAFCYYHYWFGQGNQELDLPFKEVLRLGSPDFPFCLCWANESWHTKFWNIDGSCQKKLLVEQQYLGESDYVSHFESLLNAFKDKRYYRIDGKPVFMIYRALEFPEIASFISIWQNLAEKNNLEGIFFIAQTTARNEIDKLLSLGFSAVNYVGLWEWKSQATFRYKLKKKIVNCFLRMPFVHQYDDMVKALSRMNREYADERVYPTIIPNWDHTPRSGKGGYVLNNSTPKLFELHVKSIFHNITAKPDDKKIVFLKSWNEWGEGNYMEPDLKYGCEYINVLCKELCDEK